MGRAADNNGCAGGLPHAAPMLTALAAAVLLVVPPQDSAAGRPALRVERDSPFECVRFNRGEGLSLGAGATAVVRGRTTVVRARARHAFGDARPQALLGVRRGEEGRRFEAAVFAEMRDADELAPGLDIANTIPALLLSHDDGSYVYAAGGEARLTRDWRRATRLVVTLRAADEGAPRARTRVGLAGEFPPNTPVRPGAYVVARLELSGGEMDRQWFAGAEGGGGAATFGRLWAGAATRTEIGAGVDLALAGWMAVMGATEAIPQREFRLGGSRTLRGYDAGTFRGPAAWTLTADLGAAHRVVSPVVFLDLGGTSRDDRVALAGGAGVSVLRGVVRLHVATPLDRRADARVDLVLNARR